MQVTALTGFYYSFGHPFIGLWDADESMSECVQELLMTSALQDLLLTISHACINNEHFSRLTLLKIMTLGPWVTLVSSVWIGVQEVDGQGCADNLRRASGKLKKGQIEQDFKTA